jgi:hypothetical protein
MEYVPITMIPECIHRGKVLLKKLKHPLRINGIEVLTAEAVDGARVACLEANPALRCTCVNSIINGRSAKLRSHPRLTPLLATATGLTDRGTWSIPAGGTVLRVGGGTVPAPAACPVPPESLTPAAPATAGKSGAKAPAGLKLVLRLTPSSPHQEVEKKIAVHVVVVQDDKVFATDHAARPGLPTDGTKLELATELDPKKPVWVTATTHPLTNGVWSVEPEGAPRPLVFVPKVIAAKLTRDPPVVGSTQRRSHGPTASTRPRPTRSPGGSSSAFPWSAIRKAEWSRWCSNRCTRVSWPRSAPSGRSRWPWAPFASGIPRRRSIGSGAPPGARRFIEPSGTRWSARSPRSARRNSVVSSA